jgi:histidine triad (HIT) family protein
MVSIARPKFAQAQEESAPMTDTIFSKILRGDIPCHRVYEDEHVLAFLDVAPLAPGHTLVIPKEPAATLDQLSDESSAAIGRVLPRICRAVMQATGTPAYNVLQNNGLIAHQAVAHVHFHVIPRPTELKGLGIRWAASPLEPELGKQLAAKLSELLGQ